MAKQCPRCWEKVSPDDEICPNCGYDFNRRRVQQAGAEAETEQPKKSLFPTPRKKEEMEGTTTLYKIVFVALIAWALLSLAGGAYSLYTGHWLQGAGFLASGVLTVVAIMLFYRRENRMLCSILVLISGAATLQIPFLIIALIVSYLVMCNKPDFSS